MRTRLFIALATLAVTVLVARFARGYPWELAVISGILVGGLAFVTLQTIVRLRATLSQFNRR